MPSTSGLPAQPAGRFTWEQVFAFRLRRQLLVPRTGKPAAEVARQLCGVQAQVASAAELAVAMRRTRPKPGEVDRAIRSRALVKTWAMRGTLHLLPGDLAAVALASLSGLQLWRAKAWERYFGVTAREVEQVLAALGSVLSDEPLTREELVAGVARRVRSKTVADKLASGWGELLKPAAFAGILLQGPPREGRVTFVRADAWLPGWRALDPDEAGPDLVRAYLGSYGPASPQHVGDWWARQRASMVRPWFERLGDELATVEVGGTPLLMLAGDVRTLARAEASDTVRLIPNFDQYVLGAGSGSAAFIPAARKARVSRTGGWISPVVLKGGRVAGVWELDAGAGKVAVEAWEAIPRAALAEEAAHLGSFLGRGLRVAVRRG
jgi:hypothetical protein